MDRLGNFRRSFLVRASVSIDQRPQTWGGERPLERPAPWPLRILINNQNFVELGVFTEKSIFLHFGGGGESDDQETQGSKCFVKKMYESYVAAALLRCGVLVLRFPTAPPLPTPHLSPLSA